jgi:hypothetical protein
VIQAGITLSPVSTSADQRNPHTQQRLAVNINLVLDTQMIEVMSPVSPQPGQLASSRPVDTGFLPAGRTPVMALSGNYTVFASPTPH